MLEAGDIVADRYRILGMLGKGGMGAVYAAEHIELGKIVALKMLLPTYSKDVEVVARFMREARSAAAIGHPGIVEVFDLGRDGAHAFLAMEKLEGEELYERIKRVRALPVAWVARIGVELCEAMGAAHARGVIHRDLKPQNVFLVRRGEDLEMVKVLDFGIAKLIDADRPGAALTKTGQVFGTPLYMSLEQMRADKGVDARTDIYSIGAMLYEALSGSPPFSADSYMALVLMVVGEEPVPLASLRGDLPEGLAAVVAHAMAKDVNNRYSSAAELADALRPFAAPIARPSDCAPSLDATVLAATGLAGSTPGPRRAHSTRVSVGDSRATGPVGATLGSTTTAPVTVADAGTLSNGARRPGMVTLVAVVSGLTLVLAAAGMLAWHPWTVAPQPDTALAANQAPAHAALPTTNNAPPAVATNSSPHAADDTPPARTAAQRVHIDVEPRGAEVRASDRWCTAPCDLELTGPRMALEVRKSGFVSLRRELEAPFPGSVLFTLERLRVRGPRSATEAADGPPPLVPR